MIVSQCQTIVPLAGMAVLRWPLVRAGWSL